VAVEISPPISSFNEAAEGRVAQSQLQENASSSRQTLERSVPANQRVEELRRANPGREWRHEMAKRMN
jgi:hypothetical protein